MLSSLKDRHVVITGGANGIGAAIVRAFTVQGARVSFLDMDSRNGGTLVESCSTGNPPTFYPCDLTNVSELKDLLTSIGPVDVLINNAACDDRHNIDEVTVEEWERLLDINLRHYFFASQAVAPAMISQRSGVILNLGSVTFFNGNPDLPVYVCAKGGIVGLTRSLARKWGAYGIRVNCISPGWVRTERQEKLWITPEADQKRLESQCLKEWIMPEDVANMAVFLASDAARMCTGQNFVIDGGRASI